MRQTELSTIKRDIKAIGFLYNEDSVDMRYAINNLVGVVDALLAVVSEQEEEIDQYWSSESIDDVELQVMNCVDIAFAKKGDKGDPGPEGDPGPPGPSHPDVKESIERLKDVEDRIEELSLAVQALED